MEKKTCSGCGKEFTSVRPEKYNQFCSEECREIVEDQAEQFVDDRHAIRLLANPEWAAEKLKQLTR